MKFWDDIVNTAMIGTSKKKIDATELSAALEQAVGVIEASGDADNEDKFYKTAALAFSYRQCGVMPVHKENLVLPLAAAEEKPYSSETAMQVLKDIFMEESLPLIHMWLQHCNRKNMIVHPEMIPGLLSLGTQYKNLQIVISACCGKRGEWLGQLNEAWKFSVSELKEDLWQTGTPEQRKAVFREIRKADPARSIEWLQQVWPQEDAATKLVFMELIADSVTDNDISFLTSLSGEKSKKVKDEAVQLLKQIPGSSIIQQYTAIVAQSVSLKKEKALLGLTSKTVLQFNLIPGISEEIFKSGIEKISNQKNSTDESFILYQLIGYIPPAFWEGHLNMAPKQIIELFGRSETGAALIPAIGNAAGRFKDSKWALYFIEDENKLYADLIDLLPADVKDRYLQLHISKAPDIIISKAMKYETEWSIELARKIFMYTSKNYYQYNISFYHQQIHLIPVKIRFELEKFMPAEAHLVNNWHNTSEYIEQILKLKERTIQSFN